MFVESTRNTRVDFFFYCGTDTGKAGLAGLSCAAGCIRWKESSAACCEGAVVSRGEDRQVLRQCAAVRRVAVDIRPQEGVEPTNNLAERPAKPGPVAENLLRLPQ